MRWQNTETPTFAGSTRSAAEGPAVVETLSLVDRDGNVLGSFTKGVDGGISLALEGPINQTGLVGYKTSDTSRNEDNAPAQVETATIVGGPIVTQAEIIVTASGMSNSPKTVKFTVASGDTASVVAGKARTALTADADVGGFFTISGSGADIIFTAITKAANDATMNAASDNDSCGGLTPAATSANTTSGTAAVLQIETATVVGTITPGVLQVETATIVGTITGDGNAEIIVTAVGMTGTPKTVQVAVDDGTAQVETAVVAGTVTTDGNATVIVTANGMTGTPKTVNVAVLSGVAQVETATVVGTIDVAGAGNASVTVTAAGMPNTPKTISVAVANLDTAAQVADKMRIALAADTDISNAGAGFFTVSGADADIILTANAKAANDATLNIAYNNDTCTGLQGDSSSVNTTAGVAPDNASAIAGKIRDDLTADADVGDAGTGFFVVSGSGANVILTSKVKAANDATMNISVDNGTCAGITQDLTSDNTTAGVAPDNAAAVATKIRAALTADGDVNGFFTVSGAGDDVILTARTWAANDATMNLAYNNGTCTGLTGDATSADTTAGTASGQGNATVIVTAAGMTNTPKTVNVAVADSDNANTIAGKIRTALGNDVDVNGFFTVSGATDQVILTARAAAANDATMNISVDNGTCTGITQDLTSTDTTAGVLGVLQVETATIVGTVVTQCEIIVTADGMTNSPKTVLVTVASGDTAAQVAGKVRTALQADEDIGDTDTGFLTISGSGAEVILTVNTDTDYDSTLNLASDNDTCAGLTPAASSANTTSLIVDPHLSVDLDVGTYLIEGQIPVTTADGGFKCDMSGGTVSADNFFVQYTMFDDIGTAYGTARSATLAGAGAQVAAADDSNYMLQISGSIEVGTAGSLGFRWAALIPDSTNTTVSRGAWLRASKV